MDTTILEQQDSSIHQTIESNIYIFGFFECNNSDSIAINSTYQSKGLYGK
ncbi:MAG: hypothetical protein HYZ54_09020 [Ignavibacteriae bacterium]|nr:hypothetical protein [Ignavibacteriota bacterium]